MSMTELILLLLFLPIVDLAAWTQACLAASYSVKDPAYDWMEPFAIAFKIRSIVLRYIPLSVSGVLFIISANSGNLFGIMFFAACMIFIVYIGVAGWTFYIDLKDFVMKKR